MNVKKKVINLQNNLHSCLENLWREGLNLSHPCSMSIEVTQSEPYNSKGVTIDDTEKYLGKSHFLSNKSKSNHHSEKRENKIREDLEQMREEKPVLSTSLIWTKEEMKLLLRLSNSKLRKKWKKISEIIGSKTAYQCSYKFKKLQKRNKHILFDKEDFLISNHKVKKYFEKYERYGVNEGTKVGNRIKKINNSIKYLKSSKSKKRTKKKEISYMSFQVPSNLSQGDFNSTNFPILTNSTAESYSRNNQFFRISKPNFQQDIMDFPELWENGLVMNNSLKNEFFFDDLLEPNAKINYNKQELKEDDMKPFPKLDSGSMNYAEIMRKDSPDEFLLVRNSFNKKDSKEFTRQFEKNFFEADHREDYIIKDSEFVLSNLKYVDQKIFADRCRIDEIIARVELFLDSEESSAPNLGDHSSNILYLKMMNYLSEVNSVTNGGNSYRDLMSKGLELQTRLLALMIRYTQQKIDMY